MGRGAVSVDELDLYEIAYVCGDAERAAQVVLVALWRDGRIKIAPARQRVTVERPESRDPIEAAALEVIPSTGLPLWRVLTRIAAHPAMARIAASSRTKGLRRSRRLRRRLVADPGEGLRRVAVLGTPGIEDRKLRKTFETPDPRLAEWARPKVRLRSTTDNPAPDGRRMKRAARQLDRELERQSEHSGHDHGGGHGADHGGDFGGGGGDNT
ncbi:TIGR04222 domain-containing membrane protein [Actinomadura viridis]|uniref:TIGR04222 domain-containing membrane protein n=1 Tax=Actinomadura viridis TaxID=58110 RepID=UPI00368F0259